MENEIPPPSDYKWPKYVLAGVVLGIVLAILWVSYAAFREKQERNFSAPLPSLNSR